jgi:hypothetical protein
VGVFRLSRPAEAELDDILDWSEARFHEVGRQRYAALLVQAMRDLADDPQCDGIEWVGTLGMRVKQPHLSSHLALPTATQSQSLPLHDRFPLSLHGAQSVENLGSGSTLPSYCRFR